MMMLAMASSAGAAERRATIAVASGISAADNPFLSTQATVKALLAELSIQPRLTSKTETSSVELSGLLGHRRYTGELRSDYFGNGLLAATVRKSERLAFTGSAHYRHETSIDALEDTSGALEPRSVRKALGASGSASWLVSERTTMTPSVSIERVSYGRSDDLVRSDRLSGGLLFSRRLSEYVTLGLTTNAELIAFAGAPKASVLSSGAKLAYRLSEHLVLDGTIGIERSVHADPQDPLGGRDSSINLTGRGSVCRKGQYSSLCAVASALSAPTGRGSIERRLAAGLDYALQLGEFSNLSLRVNYQRSSAIRSEESERLGLLQASAGFAKKVTDFLTIDTYLSYRRRAASATADSTQAGVNLRWKAGRE
ncbi:hypothetical protein [Sphingomonas mesophila]|uniref:hypothetical protein n=1 Tax=Sphingomonas mesophila TaxID=2303576 RepID=UPI0013C32785|nr:hypothetical protein [Sphingomonas mesophila]